MLKPIAGLIFLLLTGLRVRAGEPSPPPWSTLKHQQLAVVLVTGAEISGELTDVDTETVTLTNQDHSRSVTLAKHDVAAWSITEEKPAPPHPPAARPSGKGLKIGGGTLLGLSVPTLVIGAGMLVVSTLVSAANKECRGNTALPGCAWSDIPLGQGGMAVTVIGAAGIVTGAILVGFGTGYDRGARTMAQHSSLRLHTPSVTVLTRGADLVGGVLSWRIDF